MHTQGFLLSMSLKSREGIDWSRYPFCVPSVRHLTHITFHPAVTFFVGENGTGKSTLIEALAVSQRFNPEGGTRNFTFRTVDTHSILHEHVRVARSAKQIKDGFFCAVRAFTIWQPISMRYTAKMQGCCVRTATAPCTANRTANRFSR